MPSSCETLKFNDDFKEAEEIFREIIERWPGNVVARHGLANLLRRKSEWEEALSLLPEVTFTFSRQNRYDLHFRSMNLL